MMNQGDAELGWVRESERPFLRKARDWVDFAMREFNWKRTDFLTPREQQLLLSVVRRAGCEVAFYGGAPFCERQRALVMPADWQPENGDFGVSLLAAAALEGALTHGSVLGSVLATGIDRRKIGDIEIKDKQAVVAVCEEIVPFLSMNWFSAGRQSISLGAASEADFQGPQYEISEVSLASLRLDALVGACCRVSRSKAKGLIESGSVSVNFTETNDPDASIEVGDTISIRRFGRIRIWSERGESKKGRKHLEVGVVKSSG